MIQAKKIHNLLLKHPYYKKLPETERIIVFNSAISNFRTSDKAFLENIPNEIHPLNKYFDSLSTEILPKIQVIEEFAEEEIYLLANAALENVRANRASKYQFSTQDSTTIRTFNFVQKLNLNFEYLSSSIYKFVSTLTTLWEFLDVELKSYTSPLNVLVSKLHVIPYRFSSSLSIYKEILPSIASSFSHKLEPITSYIITYPISFNHLLNVSQFVGVYQETDSEQFISALSVGWGVTKT